MDKRTIFIRHKFQAAALTDYYEQNRLIAIEFNPHFYVNFDDYSEENRQQSGFKNAFRLFSGLASKGGLVVVQYSPKEFYLARVKSGTKIRPLDRSKILRDQNRYFSKTLKLASRRGPFNYAEYHILSALRPRSVTIASLSKHATNIIRHLWGGEKLECKLNNLHPQMLEQMCDEWLRSKYAGKFRIRYQTLRTGKTMPEIDICAETRTGKTLFVQVTHSPSRSKVKALNEFRKRSALSSPKAIALFMGPADLKTEATKLELSFVSIESVFKTLYVDLSYRRMLKQMVGIPVTNRIS